jgi:hypothetical protein
MWRGGVGAAYPVPALPFAGFDAPPVVTEPALHGLQLFQAVGIGLIESCFDQVFASHASLGGMGCSTPNRADSERIYRLPLNNATESFDLCHCEQIADTQWP